MKLTIRGNADDWHVLMYVGVLDPATGEAAFGTEVTADVTARDRFSPGTPPEAEVQISGLSAHGTELGRGRAHAYLKACDLADVLLAKVRRGTPPVHAFLEVSMGLDLEVDQMEREGHRYAKAWTPEEETD